MRLELFTHLLPVPVVLHFTYLAGGMTDFADGLYAIIAGGIGSLIPLVGAYVLRRRRLLRIERSAAENPGDAMRDLLRYPYFEARMILVRWVLGLSVAHIAFALMHHPLYIAHATSPLALIQILPISYLVHFVLVEDQIRPLIGRLAAAGGRPFEDNEKLPHFGYFSRVLLAVCSVAVLPLTLIGYLLFASLQGWIKTGDPMAHLAVLFVQVVLAMLVTSYVTARALRNGLGFTNQNLERLGKGEFTIDSVRTSTDELGDQSQLLSHVIRHLRDMYTQITSMNETLEEKVRIRTEELKETLDRVNGLKTQQDGDYFLTSLLMKPLGANKSVSSALSIDFLVLQKKRFQFKKWEAEIGGDLNMANSIYLEESRPYTVFINSDAMGKSIQGAGGALVLGAVFSSIVERTLFVPEVRSQSPERWLKNAFLDLQKVFVGFDGTMLVSLFIGLVDDETGALYYINAEHPHAILYRKNRAEFLPGQPMFFKLGTAGLDGRINVKVVRLEPDDVVLAASDGRDELVPPGAPRGDKTQFDENHFLQVVEATEGSLNQLQDLIEKSGELSDDLSVVRAGFMEDRPLRGVISEAAKAKLQLAVREANAGQTDSAMKLVSETLNEQKRNAEALALMTRLHIRRRAWKDALVSGLLSLEVDPSRTSLLYPVAFAARKSGDIQTAIAVGERLRIREPLDNRNLANLAQCHLKLANRDRTRDLIAEILETDPAHARALALRAIVERKQAR
jgi:hypothetical protein